MYTRNSTTARRMVTLVLKTLVLFSVYLFFSFYTMPAYRSVKAFVEERFMADGKIIIIGESAVTVEVADSQEERVRGLSGRESLPPGNGMFFVFDEPGYYGIWMKEMNFPIDILWFDQYGELVHVKEHVMPDTYPETFTPKVPSQYVLELPAGFVQSKSIKLGDKIDFY